MGKGAIFLSAGGTGGHLFPAEALAHELKRRGWHVHLATDARAERFTKGFPAEKIHIINSATFSSKNPGAVLRTLWKLFGGYRQSKILFKQYKPQALVGFGGYPTLPPLQAAKGAGVPFILQEQNAILGRANKLFAPAASAIATGFPLLGKDDALSLKTVVTGNPLRPPVLVAMKKPYQTAKESGTFNLLVFGGSQGAHFFSEVMPTAMALLSGKLRSRLRITLQARPEDMDAVKASCMTLGIDAEVATFFDDMPDRIANSHMVVCRAGASSVAELTAIGRPSILVPLPHSLDGDQAANAADLAEKGGAFIIRQTDLSGKRLSTLLAESMENGQGLAKMAANAKKAGMPDAALRLADMVEHVAMGGQISEYKERTS